MLVMRGTFEEPGEVVVERGVDDRIGGRCRAAQGVVVLQRGANHMRAFPGKCCRLLRIAGKARDRMAGFYQIVDDSRAHPAGGACYEDMHDIVLLVSRARFASRLQG